MGFSLKNAKGNEGISQGGEMQEVSKERTQINNNNPETC